MAFNGTIGTLMNGTNNTDPTLPPGLPPTSRFEGPWFQTQLLLSGTIGLFSFLIFSYCRTRWPLLFAPRTKLKGFSPHEAHAHQAFFGWILPTLRTSEYTVLQIVGLDAAVLLNFFKMCFYLFSCCSFLAIAVLMPINWKHHKELGDDDDGKGDDDNWPYLLSKNFPAPSSFASSAPPPRNGTSPGGDWLDLITAADTYLSVHLVFTYAFTIIALYFIYRNYKRFIRARQLFSLELVHSIPARTILITDLPRHLQGERALAEYFEGMNLSVESVTVCREVGSLKNLIDHRTDVLLKLERAWASYVGNPSSVEAYDPENSGGDEESGHYSAAHMGGGRNGRLVVPHRKRPTLRPGWFSKKVDALEYLEKQFQEADELVKTRRRTGKFKATQAAFVTFEKMSSAQIALQVAHAAMPFQSKTFSAPEPRDIVWSNMAPSPSSIRTRQVLVFAAMGALFSFWLFPIAALAGLLSYEEIKKVLPWLGRLIDKNSKIQAIIQNSLPSVAVISLNALLPFILEGLTYLQGHRARSWVEYSLMKKYFLFLLVNVVFIFLLASTYWQLARDLANYPAKIPEKLARALQQGTARNFFLSYAILQSLGIMPLQLLNLGVIIPRVFMRLFITRTPRDYAELNAPPMINYGVVYPQAILMFTITLLYSVVQPLILIFGALYFGCAYMVYKYKLLFVFYKPYESQGQAWPITFMRLIWAITIFLVFMTGFFLLSESYVLSTLLAPLIGIVGLWTWWVRGELRPLSKYVSLSSVNEVERGEESADVMALRRGHPVTASQSNLSRRRYAQNDDTLYVAPEDERTDYSQPPMANWYYGVLNTGKRRYGHPALTGVLPEPWLPLKKGQTLVNHDHSNTPQNGAGGEGQALVLTLRKRPSARGRVISINKRPSSGVAARTVSTSGAAATGSGTVENPWEDAPPSPTTARTRQQQVISHRLSFDPASGVIMLPDDGAWLNDDASSSTTDEEAEEEEDSEEVGRSQTEPSVPTVNSLAQGGSSRYGTYFHHPERRRQAVPGAFPRS